jgi:hypothetical protein
MKLAGQSIHGEEEKKCNHREREKQGCKYFKGDDGRFKIFTLVCIPAGYSTQLPDTSYKILNHCFSSS